MRSEISDWIEGSVIPRYAAFDKGHREDHARYVIDTALNLAANYDVDTEMVAVAAACHDLGLCVCRETHHLESGRIIREMDELRQWFNAEQIETIAEAAEDHRASSKSAPRSIYGRLIAEADRQIVPEVVIRRTIQFGMNHYPELDKEGHWQRTLEHLQEKYAEGGYLKLWIPESTNALRLGELRGIIRDRQKLRAVFESIYKDELYRDLLPKVCSLTEGCNDGIARMANIAAAIHRTFGFWWTGFYRVSGNELILGPFQGPVACMHIPFSKGVCGTAWERGETIVVPDVELFPGHIACSSESRSEIVVPVRTNGAITAVLDIDSASPATFDDIDRRWLEEIVKYL